MARPDLSAAESRRIAVAAQGLARPVADRPVTRARLRRMVEQLGAVQLDSVNVLTRSHYLPAFARLGPYDQAWLEAEAWGPRPTLFEYWGHEASLLPLALHPLFRWRMARARAGETWGGLAKFARERGDFIAGVLGRMEAEGPLTGGDLADGPRQSGWWSWSHGKQALEWLFWGGLITTRTRRGFERVYDLTERVIPRTILDLPTPDEADAQRALLRIAAGALGVATAGDLRDYFRLPLAGVASRLQELVEDGGLVPVSVEGWRQPAFLAPDADRPRRARVEALLSPFDNLIWCRERAERLFGARIRLEIYTPAHRREHGYYVLPLLAEGRIVARVDLKADRPNRRLLARASHLEEGADADAAAHAMAGRLRAMAGWLGLETVRVDDAGALAGALESSLATSPARSKTSQS